MDDGYMVSVPSRGLCFQSIAYFIGISGSAEFPSPLGDYVFNLLNFSNNKFFNVRFRPLSGIMFSIETIIMTKKTGLESFPSPLGDYVFNRLDELL